MRKLKFSIVFFIICLLQFSCSETTNLEVEQKFNIFPEGTELEGKGEYYPEREWELSVFDNDSILLIQKNVRDSVGVHTCIIQSLGYLINSKKYSYEIIITSSIFGGLQKSSYPYLDSDTIPILIDTSLLTNNFNWQLNYKDTSVHITNTHFLYKHPVEPHVALTFNPNTVLSYKPFTISVIGNRSSVGISRTGYPNQKFYLNEKNDTYQLIIERLYSKKGNNNPKIKEDTIVKIINLYSVN